MAWTTDRIEQTAETLAQAQHAHTLIERPLGRADATLADAYAVQRALEQRLRRRDEPPYGFKVATTSAAAMQRLGIDEPLYGFLTSAGRTASGETIDLRGLRAPRIEMELAFITASALHGGACTPDEVIAATAYVMPAFEIIDSRFVAGAFDVVAAVADNVSTARHVLGGERLDPRTVDLAAVNAVLEKNGALVAEGSGANVLGHPANAVAWLVRTLAQRGRGVPARSVILSGGFSDALPAAAGDTFTAHFTPGGTIACTFSAPSPPGSSA